MLRLALAALLCALLSACGGGSGGSSSASSAPTPPAAPPVSHAIDFGYFGTGDGQLAATSASISFVHAVDWGDWGRDREAIKLRIIDQLQEAHARGVPLAMVSTGFLTFDAQCHWLGTTELVAFKYQLDALGLTRNVTMLYPMDEPEVHGCSDATMTQAFTETKAAWPGPKIAVIYGPGGDTPGIAAADLVGRDDYGAGVDVLSRLPPLHAGQNYIVVPGGADPYRQDPSPFVGAAKADPRITVIMPFLFVPYTDPGGHARAGIGNNGMLPQYIAAGCAATGKC